MNNESIKKIALSNGFKLKQQPNGSLELNPYVYDFAKALTEELLKENAELREDVECLKSIVNGTAFVRNSATEDRGPVVSDHLTQYLTDIKADAVIDAIENTRVSLYDGGSKWWCRVVDLEECASKLRGEAK